jgi:hypothetical protein
MKANNNAQTAQNSVLRTRKEKIIEISTNQTIEMNVPPSNTRPNMAVGSPLSPGGAREGRGGVSGGKIAKKYKPMNS